VLPALPDLLALQARQALQEDRLVPLDLQDLRVQPVVRPVHREFLVLLGPPERLERLERLEQLGLLELLVRRAQPDPLADHPDLRVPLALQVRSDQPDLLAQLDPLDQQAALLVPLAQLEVLLAQLGLLARLDLRVLLVLLERPGTRRALPLPSLSPILEVSLLLRKLDLLIALVREHACLPSLPRALSWREQLCRTIRPQVPSLFR